MNKRCRLAANVVALLGLCGSALGADLPVGVPVPPALAARVHDGVFDPGDFGWLCGAFPGATVAQRHVWAGIEAYITACAVRDTRVATQTVRQIQAPLTQSLEERPYDDTTCALLWVSVDGLKTIQTWQAFSAALKRQRPMVEAFLHATDMAQAVADEQAADNPAAQLLAAVVTDQVLRDAVQNALDLRGTGETISPDDRALRDGLIWMAITRRDHRNTAWLKARVARDGWPTIASQGAEASHAAWLLVQHADDDIVFQYQELRAMEPLVKSGEVSASDFAFLFDRVMLKLVGTQRYGTQFVCKSHMVYPQPLEDVARVDEFRRSAGLSTLEQRRSEIAARPSCR